MVLIYECGSARDQTTAYRRQRQMYIRDCINIASMLAFQGGIRVPSYTASKSGIAGITRLLANEWASKGIHINAIAPGTFAAVITGDKVAKGKPDPEPYLHAARMCGVEITDCIAVGDSVTGITSAYASGARTIGIKAVTEVPVWSGLSRVASLDQITPAVLDIIMSGGTVDLLGPNA